MTDMHIHDTLTGKNKSPLKSQDATVSVYLCGVTVYDDAHIGHARTIITFDVLRRYLARNNIKVVMVQNFTDVDDKIIARAREKGMSAADLANMYIARYYDEFDNLNVLRADSYPKATEHIGDIISFISRLVENGAAYASENGIYFDVTSFDQYGKLSKKKTHELQSGSRIKIDESKHNPLDFALWKFDKGDPSWNSPWGTGRPGWHIECSTMSMKYFADGIDIHGGGRDLMFPHHENEIAQSESLSDGNEFVRIWMHVGMVTIQGEKMSKSLGNIRSIKQALEDWGPNTIRMFCISGHYSKSIDYSEKNLQESLTRWRQLEACCYEIKHVIKRANMTAQHTKFTHNETESIHNETESTHNEAESATHDMYATLRDVESRFNAALEDDLNTHLALSALMEIVAETNARIANGSIDVTWAVKAEDIILSMSDVLGLELDMPDDTEYNNIDKSVAERNHLRKNKKYKEADAIRDMLAAKNIEIIDRKDQTIWIKKSAAASQQHTSID